MDHDLRGNLAVHKEAAVRLLAVSQGSVDICRRAPVHRSSRDGEKNLCSRGSGPCSMACQSRAFGEPWVNHVDDDVVRIDILCQLDDK